LDSLLDTSPTRWVFGYGSLIWQPGFAFVSRQRALLRGSHRSLCIYSHVHRGTPERPGLVFGLKRGGACLGMAFEVSEADWIETRDYLRAREQVTAVYREVERPVRLADGRSALALAYVADERHEQFAGRLGLEDQYRLVRDSAGRSGSNPDYVLATARQLAELGIRDPHLEALAGRLRADQASLPASTM
jgi:cation transport protein ChaC